MEFDGDNALAAVDKGGQVGSKREGRRRISFGGPLVRVFHCLDLGEEFFTHM